MTTQSTGTRTARAEAISRPRAPPERRGSWSPPPWTAIVGPSRSLVRRHQRPLVNHLYRQIGRAREPPWTWRRRSSSRSTSPSPASTRPTGSRPGSTGSHRTAPSTTCARKSRKPAHSYVEALRTTAAGDRRSTSPATTPRPTTMLRLRELQGRLEHAVQVICRPDFRQLILLRHRQHCRYDEIARITDLPLGTVKNRIFRAREMLRGQLADLLGPES